MDAASGEASMTSGVRKDSTMATTALTVIPPHSVAMAVASVRPPLSAALATHSSSSVMALVMTLTWDGVA